MADRERVESLLDHSVASLRGGYVNARDALNAALEAIAHHDEVAFIGVMKVPPGEAIASVLDAVADAAVVEVIRSLGFIGGSHYCADCLNHFHSDHGQHEAACEVLAGLFAEDRL